MRTGRPGQPVHRRSLPHSLRVARRKQAPALGDAGEFQARRAKGWLAWPERRRSPAWQWCVAAWRCGCPRLGRGPAPGRPGPARSGTRRFRPDPLSCRDGPRRVARQGHPSGRRVLWPREKPRPQTGAGLGRDDRAVGSACLRDNALKQKSFLRLRPSRGTATSIRTKRELVKKETAGDDKNRPRPPFAHPCNFESKRANSRCSAFDKRPASPSSNARTLSRAAAKYAPAPGSKNKA